MAAIVFVNEWTPTTVALNEKSKKKNKKTRKTDSVETTKLSLYDAPYKYDAVIYLLNKLLKMSYFIFLHTHLRSCVFSLQ